MVQRVLLNDRQIELLLTVLDICSREEVPDNFWDEQRQRVVHYNEEGERVEECLDVAVNRMLDPEKFDL